MPLTVKEKEHWKQRIEKKIDKAIEKVYRDEGNGLKMSVREEARERALKRRKLDSYMIQHDSLKAQIAALSKRQQSLADEAAKPFVVESPSRSWLSGHALIENVIEKEATEIEKEILQESEVGLEILKLEREREELTDTIWLATSPVQIRSLWKDFTTMVTEEPTQLQKQALTYEPVNESK